MKLMSFSGTAAIMGKNLSVVFSEGMLSVGPIDTSEALALIKVLEGLQLVQPPAEAPDAPPAAAPKLALVPPATGHMNGAAPERTPPRAGTPAVDPATVAAIAKGSPAAAPKAAKGPAAAKASPGVAAAPAAEPSTTPPIAPATAPSSAAVEQDAPAATSAAVAKPPAEKPKAATPTNGAPVPMAAGEVPPEMANARKLKDVLSVLITRGITDKDALKAECARIKNDVPVLSRITNLDERIDRTLEVIDMGGAEA